jgi:hypothetical protein
MDGHDEDDHRQEPGGGDEKAHGRHPTTQLFDGVVELVRKASTLEYDCLP